MPPIILVPVLMCRQSPPNFLRCNGPPNVSGSGSFNVPFVPCRSILALWSARGHPRRLRKRPARGAGLDADIVGLTGHDPRQRSGQIRQPALPHIAVPDKMIDRRSKQISRWMRKQTRQAERGSNPHINPALKPVSGQCSCGYSEFPLQVNVYICKIFFSFVYQSGRGCIWGVWWLCRVV